MNVRREMEKVKPGASISLILLKSTKGTARFNVLIGRSNRYQQYTCALISYALPRDLRFCPGVFGTEINYWDFASPGRNKKKSLPCRGSNPKLLRGRQWLLLCATALDCDYNLEGNFCLIGRYNFINPNVTSYEGWGLSNSSHFPLIFKW